MFENLSEIRRAKDSSSTGTRKAQFKMKINEAKSTIIFSTDQFAEMNIADNSLSQFIDASKRVFLAVMPGNSGSFAKTNARGTKGKKFKNEKLTKSLVENDYNFAEIDLVKIGEEDGKTLYQITGNNTPLLEINENLSDVIEGNAGVAAEMTKSQQDIINFENAGNNDVTDVAKDNAIEDKLSANIEEEPEF